MLKTVSLKSLLAKELRKKKAKNKSYSLRAFARDLRVPVSQLSKYLNHEQGLSIRTVQAILDLLDTSILEREFILSQFITVQSKNPKKIKEAKQNLKSIKDENYTHLEFEAFDWIREWQYCGILALVETAAFCPDPKWISEKLNIPLEQASQCLKQMLKEEMIKEGDGKMVVNGHFFTAPRNFPSQSIQKFHDEIMKKASASLAKTAVEERDFSSLVFSAKESQFEEAKKFIQEFRELFDQRFSISLPAHERDRVYALGIQLFPLTPRLEAENVEETLNQKLKAMGSA